MSASPFPGMDPYLELYWRDVHHRLITYACDQLQTQLPHELRARMEERVFVTGDDGQIGRRVPDVRVVEYPRRSTATGPAPQAIVDERTEASDATEPFMIELPEWTVTETYIEIIDVSSGNHVVTAIEFISPSNKLSGAGRDEYQRKQRECAAANVNLVEIDLTRGGPRRAILPLDSIPSAHHTVYLTTVLRFHPSRRLEYYPITLQSRLPSIRIPLRRQDRDCVLRLQPLVDQAYVNGRYADLDCQSELIPPLEETDTAWLAETRRAARRQA